MDESMHRSTKSQYWHNLHNERSGIRGYDYNLICGGPPNPQKANNILGGTQKVAAHVDVGELTMGG
jgi:hypothetical protein